MFKLILSGLRFDEKYSKWDLMVLKRRATDPDSEAILRIFIPACVQKSMEAERAAYLSDLRAGLCDEALIKINQLIKTKENCLEANTDELSVYELLLVRCDKLTALIRLGRCDELPSELHKAKEVARDGWNVESISELLARQQQVKKTHDYEMLKLPQSPKSGHSSRSSKTTNSTISNTTEKLTPLAHPSSDKFSVEPRC